MNLGERLYQLRRGKNLSQEEVAELLNVTRQTVSKWETNQSTPDFDKIAPLCELYQISTNYLVTGKEEEKEKIGEKSKKEAKAKQIALGIFLYFIAVIWIMIAIPVIDLNPIIASACFLIICAVATYIIVYASLKYKKEKKELTKEEKLIKQINEVISVVTLVIYLIVSFVTMAWHITWILWIVNGLVEEVVKLIFQLKENQDEK